MSKRKRIIAFISVFVVLLSTLLPFTAAAWDVVISDRAAGSGAAGEVSVYTPPNAFVSFSYPYFNSDISYAGTYPTFNFLNYLTSEAYIKSAWRDENFSAWLPPSDPYGEQQFYLDISGQGVTSVAEFLHVDSYGFEINSNLTDRTDKTIADMHYRSLIYYPSFPQPQNELGEINYNDLECYLRIEDSYFVDYDHVGDLFEFSFRFYPHASNLDFWELPAQWLIVEYEYSFIGSDVIHTRKDWFFIVDYIHYNSSGKYVDFYYNFDIDDQFPEYSDPSDNNGAYVDANGKKFPGIYMHSFSVNLPLSSFCDSSVLQLEFESYVDLSLPDYRTLDLEAKMANFNPEDVPLTVSWLGNAVGGFFDLQFVPGFSLGGIFLIIIAFSVVMWFLRVFGGG